MLDKSKTKARPQAVCHLAEDMEGHECIRRPFVMATTPSSWKQPLPAGPFCDSTLPWVFSCPTGHSFYLLFPCWVLYLLSSLPTLSPEPGLPLLRIQLPSLCHALPNSQLQPSLSP